MEPREGSCRLEGTSECPRIGGKETSGRDRVMSQKTNIMMGKAKDQKGEEASIRQKNHLYIEKRISHREGRRKLDMYPNGYIWRQCWGGD